MWQKTYACAKMFVYSHTVSMPNPNPNLSPSSEQAVPLPWEGTIVLMEVQVAAHVQTRRHIFRLWDYEYGCCTCRQFIFLFMNNLETLLYYSSNSLQKPFEGRLLPQYFLPSFDLCENISVLKSDLFPFDNESKELCPQSIGTRGDKNKWKLNFVR